MDSRDIVSIFDYDRVLADAHTEEALRFANNRSDKPSNILYLFHNTGNIHQEPNYAIIPELEDTNVLLKLAVDDPKILKYASISARDDKNIVKTIVEKHGKALQYASSRLRKDVELQNIALNSDGLALKGIINPTPDHRLLAVKKNGLAIKYVYTNHYTPELLFSAVLQNGLAIQYIQGMRTPELIITAVLQNKLAINYIPAHLQQTESVKIICGLVHHASPLI